MNEGLRVRCGSRSSPLRVGRRPHDRPGHSGLAGSGNPGSDRGEGGRTAEDREGPRIVPASASKSPQVTRESPSNHPSSTHHAFTSSRHCRGCGNSPEPMEIRPRTCNRRSGWTTPFGRSISQPCSHSPVHSFAHSTASPVGPSAHSCAVHTGYRRGERTPAETRGVRPRADRLPEASRWIRPETRVWSKVVISGESRSEPGWSKHGVRVRKK